MALKAQEFQGQKYGKDFRVMQKMQNMLIVLKLSLRNGNQIPVLVVFVKYICKTQATYRSNKKTKDGEAEGSH